MNGALRVLVADDSTATRAMLREALGLDGGIEVVGEAQNGEEAFAGAVRLRPDVVLMDVRMPGGDGVHATRRIVSECPPSRVVALTWSDDPATVRDMVAAGAVGYVVKGGTIDELCLAIHRAGAGDAHMDQRVLAGALEDLRRLLLSDTGDRVAHPRRAVETAARRLRASPDMTSVPDEAWEGVPHPVVDRVTYELLSNAVRHGRPPVRISVRREDPRAILTVTDTGGWDAGPGSLLRPYGEDPSRTRPRGAPGRGLLLVTRLCEWTGGSLSIRAVDGTTFAQATFGLRTLQ